MKVYILRETDGIDEWILGVYASRTLAEDAKYREQKSPRVRAGDEIAVYGITDHEVIEK